jgi:hypothetical protein
LWQPAQPEHKPEQAQNKKPNNSANPQEEVVLSNQTQLLTEKKSNRNGAVAGI